MEITTTELEPCKLLVHCQANAIEIMDKRHEVLQQFKSAPVPGNRKGKATLEAIKFHYHKQIEESLKRALAESCYHEAVFQKELRVLGAPNFKSIFLDGGKYTCDLEIMVKPTFTVPDWKAYELPRPHQAHTAEEVVQQIFQQLRIQYGDQIPFSDHEFVQENDNVVIDYEATQDGVKIESLCAKDEVMTIGKSALTGFDQNLLGMNIGDERTFDFVAPNESLPSIAGKTLQFKVKVSAGSKTLPAPLDDELATRMGKKDFNELKEAVGQAAFSRVENLNRTNLHNSIARKMVSETEINVPTFLSTSQAQYLAQQAKVDWNALSDVDRERFLEMAIENVKLSLILDAIRENTPETQLTDQEVYDMVKQSITASQQPGTDIDQLMQQANQSGYLSMLMGRVRDERCMQIISKDVKLID